MFFCQDIAIEGFVFGLCFELCFVGSTSGWVCQGSLGRSSCLTEQILTIQLCLRVRFGTRVADLRGEGLAVHLFEDNVGMFADFATELAEWGF